MCKDNLQKDTIFQSYSIKLLCLKCIMNAHENVCRLRIQYKEVGKAKDLDECRKPQKAQGAHKRMPSFDSQ